MTYAEAVNAKSAAETRLANAQDNLRTELADKEKQLADLQKNLEATRKQLDEKASHEQATRDNLSTELANKDKQLKALQKDLETKKQLDQALNDMEATLNDLRGENNRLKNEVKTLDSELDDLQQRMDMGGNINLVPAKQLVVDKAVAHRLTDPAVIQSEAYANLVQADRYLDAGQLKDAHSMYKVARDYYIQLNKDFPGWEPRVIQFRRNYCDTQIADIERRM